jgi:hypothetical protein
VEENVSVWTDTLTVRYHAAAGSGSGWYWAVVSEDTLGLPTTRQAPVGPFLLWGDAVADGQSVWPNAKLYIEHGPYVDF